MKGSKREAPAICPDCRGSGRYVGLTVIESCRACGGTGRLAPPRIDVIKSRVLDHRLFELVLTKQGYEVESFDSIGNYLHQLDSSPDCIITGWFFRTLGVADLLTELEDRGLHVPVIVSTTLDVEPDELPMGVFAVLTDHALGTENYLRTVRDAVAAKRRKYNK
jgi:DNA-binding NtrC family response regulator